MSDINDEIDVYIQRHRMRFLNDSRTCNILEDIPETQLGRYSIGPFRPGDQASLPNWIIEKLQQKNWLEVTEDENYESLENLQRIQIKQREQPFRLQHFHQFLYAALTRRLLLMRSDKTSLDSRQYNEIKQLEQMIENLRGPRLSQVIRAAKTENWHDMKKQMTLEERWLSEQIATLLSEWNKSAL